MSENKRKWYEIVGDGEDLGALWGLITAIALVAIGTWLLKNY